MTSKPGSLSEQKWREIRECLLELLILFFFPSVGNMPGKKQMALNEHGA